MRFRPSGRFGRRDIPPRPRSLTRRILDYGLAAAILFVVIGVVMLVRAWLTSPRRTSG